MLCRATRKTHSKESIDAYRISEMAAISRNKMVTLTYVECKPKETSQLRSNIFF
jgi:hypothetical protein